jgi:transcriptional regulator with XRE-family HTH domain
VTKSIFHPNYDEFRQKLTAARKSAGLTQIGLAQKLGKPQSFVSKFERGERRLDVQEFFQVAEALNFDPFAFLKSIYGTAKRGKGSL